MSKFSIHCSYVIWGGIFYWFTNSVVSWGLSLQWRTQGLWCLMWSSNHSFLRECCTFVIALNCGLLQLWCVFFLDQPISLHSSLCWCCPFTVFCGGFVHPIFRSYFWENYSIFSYRFVMSVGGSKFKGLHDHQETSECWTSLTSLEQILLYNSFSILFVLLIFC